MISAKRLLLIGGGGHCKSVLDSLQQQELYTEYGIVDCEPDATFGGIPIIGKDEDLPRLLEEGWKDAFITGGSIGDSSVRNRLFEMIKLLGFNLPIIIDPSAIVAKDAIIGEGTFIGKSAIVNSRTIIGNCSIINSGAIIEHDCKIGNLCHVSTGASLCGGVRVGDYSHIGAGTVIRQCIAIGSNALIGIGSVVVKDIPDNAKAYGNPCRMVD